MQKHITVVAALQIGFGILGVFIGFLIMAVLAWAGSFVEEPEVIMLLPTLAVVLGGGLALLSAVSVIGGIGVLKRKNWGRIIILIVSVFDLLNIPIGTAIAVYTFWVLVQDETVKLFDGQQPVTPVASSQPPGT